MQHIHGAHEQLPHLFTSLLWLIFDLQIGQYCEMFIENLMVFVLKHCKVVIANFSNKPYGEITSDSVRRYGGMIDNCQVRGCTKVCRCVVSVRRRNGGTVADQVARWRTRWHGGMVV